MKHRTWLLALCWILTACAALPAAPTPVAPEAAATATPLQAVPVTKVAPGPGPARVACTPLPEDMALRVEALSPTAAQVEVEGLRPGERPTLILEAEAPGQGAARIERRDGAPVGPDGRYMFRQSGLYPVAVSLSNRWEVRLVHARGVACTRILLPPPILGPPAPPARFPDAIRLEGYRLSAVGLIRGKPVLLILYWRGEQPVVRSPIVSVRVVDKAGQAWAQDERPLELDPNRLDALTAHWLTLPTHAPDVVYTVRVALNDPQTGEGKAAPLFPMAALPDTPRWVTAGLATDFPSGSVTALNLSATAIDWDPSPMGIKMPEQGTQPPQPVSPVRVFLVHDPELGFLALYNRDPFRGCYVQWRAAEGRFIDPCLGSHYDRRGEHCRGPGWRGLDRFATEVREVAGETYVMVDVSYLVPGPPR